MSARRASARLLHVAAAGGGAAAHRRPALAPATTLVRSAKAAKPAIKLEKAEKALQKQPKRQLVVDPSSLPEQPAAKRPRAIKTEKTETRVPRGTKAAAAKGPKAAAAASSKSAPPAGWEQTWDLIVELRADRTAVVDRMGSVSNPMTVFTGVAPVPAAQGHR